MPAKVKMKCLVCKGRGKQTVVATELLAGGVERKMDPVDVGCVWCHGKGWMNPDEWSDYKDINDMWCECEEPGEAVYHPDGESDVCEKHHWTCSKCGKIMQVG